MNAGRACVNLRDDLFELEEPEESTPTQPDSSPEMLAMVSQVEQRLERRARRSKSIGASVFNRALAEVDSMIESGDWSEATARHLVALYDRMHEKCYGVEAIELGPSERYNATMMAANMLRHKFNGDMSEAIAFMRHTWTEEIRKEKWCRENGRERNFRIGVRLMFGGQLVTDYRLALARRSSRT